MVGKIDSNSRNLAALINNVLDISRIEADQIVVELTAFAVEPLVREVLDELETVDRRVVGAGGVPGGRGSSDAQKRSPEGQAGAREPVVERAEVHDDRHHPNRGDSRCPNGDRGGSPSTTPASASPRPIATNFRGIRAGRTVRHGLGRHRARPRDFSSSRATARRRRGRRQHVGAGSTFVLTLPLEPQMLIAPE